MELAAPTSLSRGRRLRPLLHVRVWWSRERLTRLLAEGAPFHPEEQLVQRARQLTGEGARQAVAAALLEVAADAANPHRPLGSRARPAITVPLLRTELTALVERLRAPAPVRAQGVALATLLVTDPAGPLFLPGGELTLQDALELATAALEEAVPVSLW
jgi:hypothetical protein